MSSCRKRLRAALSMVLAVAVSPAPAAGMADEEFGEAQISSVDREHWSFQPLKRSTIPEVKDAQRPHNPIDRFVLARLEAIAA